MVGMGFSSFARAARGAFRQITPDSLSRAMSPSYNWSVVSRPRLLEA
jgi:hypothetical protein